jgi:hypothetical protein
VQDQFDGFGMIGGEASEVKISEGEFAVNLSRGCIGRARASSRPHFFSIWGYTEETP